MENADLSDEDMTALRTSLEKCILYKGATPSFMGEFSIGTFCGFSMYLPCDGSLELDKFYKTLQWNQATGLVQ